MNQVRFIPIEEIVINNDYLRLNTKIEELKKSIQAVGLIHPLIINKDNELIAGGRRFSALKELGVEQIPVVVVEHDRLAQELISIDENLMRLPLKNIQMEKALNRGREIYETLYPEAKKVQTTPELDKKPGRPPAAAAAAGEGPAPLPADPDEDIVDGKASFVEVTALKTGLSQGAIRSAIIRDERSSDLVKAARIEGELGASQANEIIKLRKEEQDKILPIVKGKSTTDVRKIVKEAKVHGIEETIEKVMQHEPLPKEYAQLLLTLKRAHRTCKKILKQELQATGPERALLLGLVQTTAEALQEIAGLHDEEPEAPAAEEPSLPQEPVQEQMSLVEEPSP